MQADPISTPLCSADAQPYTSQALQQSSKTGLRGQVCSVSLKCELEVSHPDELVKSDTTILVGVHLLHDVPDLCLGHTAAMPQRVTGQAIQQHLHLTCIQ